MLRNDSCQRSGCDRARDGSGGCGLNAGLVEGLRFESSAFGHRRIDGRPA